MLSDGEAAARLTRPLRLPSADEVVQQAEGSTSPNKARRGRPRKTEIEKLTPHEERMAELEVRSQAPFVRLLGALLEAAPSERALKAWARTSPDKWAAAVVNVAKICGYMERQAATSTAPTLVMAMKSDQELRQMAGQLAQEMTNKVAERLASGRPTALVEHAAEEARGEHEAHDEEEHERDGL